MLAIIPVLAGVVGAIAAAMTGIGAPAGILSLIAGLLTALGAVAVGFYNAKSSYDNLKSTAATVQAKVSHSHTFNNGWPAATVDGKWRAD